MDLLFLVVRGDFIPLLYCNACLHLEVLKFMNLDILEVPQANAKEKQKIQDRTTIIEFLIMMLYFQSTVIVSA